MLVKTLTSIAIGFLSGVFAHSIFFSEQFSLIIMTTIIAIGVILSLFKKHIIILIGVFIIGFSLGCLRFSSSINTNQADIFDVFVSENQDIAVRGSITSDPINTPSYTQFYLDVEGIITREGNLLSAPTRVLITTDNYTQYGYGQIVEVYGTIQKPDSFITDTNRVFNYESYLSKDGVYYVIRFAETNIINNGPQSIQRILFSFKKKFLYQIYRYIPEPESGLLAGILFGEKSALSNELEEKFRIVGLMHIVVLSGYNVSLVIQIFTKALRFLPRGIRSFLAVISIAGFALLVGAGPTVIRASIMAVFIVLADVLGARYHITRALFVAGVCMVIWNPMILYFDISFQLSFLATYGLIVVSPIVERWLQRLPQFLAIRESAVATVSAQIMVAPLIIYSIGEFSLISPVVNVLVLFAVPIAMLIGFITAVSGMIVPSLANVLAVISTYLLKYQLWVVEIFADIPFAHITIPPFHWVIMLVLYVGIFWWVFKIHNSYTHKI